METLKQVLMQETNELRYNRKHIDAKIREEILANPKMVAKINLGVEMLKEWLAGSYYPSKNQRLAQISLMDLPTLVLDLFVGVCYSQQPQLFTSVTAQTAARLGFSDKTAAITTVAEVLSILCHTDAFDLIKESKQASIQLVSTIPLSQKLLEFIEHSEYLPPMVCEPLELTHNFSSGYLTHNDSLILGAGNHHDGDICLDVLNTMNKVEFKLDLNFLCKVEEEPTELTPEAIYEKALKKGKMISMGEAVQRANAAMENWNQFKSQSYRFYSLIATQGNRLWMTNKVDKRGRIYSQGYHITPQGAPFKKAMLELAKEEVVTGVPA
jgi:hypothetical protein